MSHVLVFLTIHGLGAPMEWVLASGALLYRLRLDQIVRFPMILELDEVWGTLRGTSSCIISVSDVSRRIVRLCENRLQLGWCSIAIQFLITFFLSYDILFQRTRIQQAKIL